VPVHLAPIILHLIVRALGRSACAAVPSCLAQPGSAARGLERNRDARQCCGVHSLHRQREQQSLASVIVNSWILVGRRRVSGRYDYGRLLLVKIGRFLVILAIACVNRCCSLLVLVLAEVSARAASACVRFEQQFV